MVPHYHDSEVFFFPVELGGLGWASPNCSDPETVPRGMARILARITLIKKGLGDVGAPVA
jgi:hypothetical protein